MDPIQFLQKQGEIYDRFKDEDKFLKDGVIPNVKPQQSGYLVIFRHPDSIAERVQKLSEKINTITPVVLYSKSHIHTTITDYKLTEEDFTPDKNVLENMARAVHDIKKDITASEIFYFDWFTNSNTVIAAGTPDDNFLDVAQKYLTAAEKIGLTTNPKEGGIRMPWGAHITAARYMNKLDPVKDKEKIKELLNTIKSTPVLGISKTEFIDVGYFTIKGDKMEYTIHERFKI
ncbi:MAG: hypothetical protein KatS3mg002_0209 [Candidatus Woesearchaeota archaeon]|nr:MAG: hypothetical protein KatS3mg002_0209 [Candidatus Woesearchaeota archaeon]